MSSPFRIVNGELFYVTHLDPTPREDGAINGLRKQGTDARKLEADCGDASMLALVIERHHDYPEADMLGHYIAD